MSIVGNMPALLLIGPTGSGKSPLGALLEKHTGWAHFDFGHELRAIARGAADHDLAESEVEYITELLSNHELFPDEEFDTVKKILESFLEKNGHAPGVILNGLPRHVGQAKDMNRMVEIKKVAVLNCTLRDATARIARRGTSDPAVKPDDTHGAVLAKFSTFAEETIPLVDHYRNSDTDIIDVIVESGTTESNIASRILEWF